MRKSVRCKLTFVVTYHFDYPVTDQWPATEGQWTLGLRHGYWQNFDLE